jgi:hypothetical protein
VQCRGTASDSESSVPTTGILDKQAAVLHTCSPRVRLPLSVGDRNTRQSIALAYCSDVGLLSAVCFGEQKRELCRLSVSPGRSSGKWSSRGKAVTMTRQTCGTYVTYRVITCVSCVLPGKDQDITCLLHDVLRCSRTAHLHTGHSA